MAASSNIDNTVTSLDLRCKEITNQECKYIAKKLKINSTITVLDIGRNPIYIGNVES